MIIVIIIVVNRCPPLEPEETRLYKSISRARRTSYRRAPISRRDRCPTTVYIYLSLALHRVRSLSLSLSLSHSLLYRSLALALSDHSCNNHRRTIAVSRARTLHKTKNQQQCKQRKSPSRRRLHGVSDEIFVAGNITAVLRRFRIQHIRIVITYTFNINNYYYDSQTNGHTYTV